MRPVTHDYQSLNEYTLPLQGKPYYRSSGIIYAVDRNGNKYAVGQVDLERFDDQNFQYVFTPEWSVIDTLPSSTRVISYPRSYISILTTASRPK